jgi:hypothetical protein
MAITIKVRGNVLAQMSGLVATIEGARYSVVTTRKWKRRLTKTVRAADFPAGAIKAVVAIAIGPAGGHRGGWPLLGGTDGYGLMRIAQEQL